MAGGVFAQDDDDGPPPVQVPIVIEQANVSLTVDGGFDLTIDGNLGTGCDIDPVVEQIIDERTLQVEIYQLVPADVFCPMVLVPYEATISLDVEIGLAQIVVNDVETFDLPGAQAAPEVPTARIPHQITEVVLVETDDEPTSLRISGVQPDGCDFPVAVTLTQPAEDAVYVTIVREIPVTVDCPDEVIDYETMVELPEDLPASTTVEVNRWAGLLIDRLDDGWTLQQGQRQSLIVVNVDEIVTETGEAALQVEGTFMDGCETALRSRVEQETDTLVVQVYRVFVPEIQSCPVMILDYRTIITFDEVEPGDYAYTVNGIGLGVLMINEPEPDRANRVPHVIETVSATVEDGAIVVNAVGFIPDGCESETLREVTVDDETAQVTLYRNIPPGVMCPMNIVDYDETFTLDDVSPEEITQVSVNKIIAEIE